ncbi:MAG: M15 family metallopeptidase [Desulfopila sp.]|nr:M15 family metallopeptidase [Desulfopila sp.]
MEQTASPINVPSPLQVPEKTVVPPQPSEIVEIVAVKRKKIVEFVEIEGKRYQVPPLWRGRKITEKAADVAELRQIPIKYTWKETKLYIHYKACDAFVAMAAKAEEDGVRLQAHSGFRSIHYQKKIFSKGMAKGRSWEDMVRYVAPPGYSEHMLGTVVDLYPSDWRFAATAAYEWLREHAAAFGFVESYPKTNSEGLPWEAWHWRYIDQL